MQWFSYCYFVYVFKLKNNITIFFLDVTTQEQEELMIRKLRQCSVPFDFMDPMAELKGKEIKRDTLNELVDYVSTSRGVLTENMYPEIIKMVCTYFLICFIF